MSRVLFVVPEAVTLPLWDDGAYWISVKKQLNAGEVRQLAQGALTRVSRTGSDDAPSVAFDVNPEAGAFAKVLIYLLDWNLTDASGKTVPIDTQKAKRDALRALDQDVFAEIERVLDVHTDAIAKEKKLPSGLPTPAATS